VRVTTASVHAQPSSLMQFCDNVNIFCHQCLSHARSGTFQ